MRENRTYGSEGGEAKSLPYPYRHQLEKPRGPNIRGRPAKCHLIGGAYWMPPALQS